MKREKRWNHEINETHEKKKTWSVKDEYVSGLLPANSE